MLVYENYYSLGPIILVAFHENRASNFEPYIRNNKVENCLLCFYEMQPLWDRGSTSYARQFFMCIFSYYAECRSFFTKTFNVTCCKMGFVTRCVAKRPNFATYCVNYCFVRCEGELVLI